VDIIKIKPRTIFKVYLTFGKSYNDPNNLKYQGELYFNVDKKYSDIIWEHFHQ